MSGNTQLTLASGYDAKRVIFSKPEVNSIPNSVPAISYTRINIGTANTDGSTGDLVLLTENLFSFGVCENKDAKTQEVNGYVMPLCLWSKDNPTELEKEWVSTFDKIVERCKDHVLDVKDDIGKYDIERNDLKKLNPLYWKREKGKLVDGVGPTLYAKVIQSKKTGKVITSFVDENSGNELELGDVMGKYCYVKAAVKIESIYVGSRISLQVKLLECNVKLYDNTHKRLLGGIKAPMVTSSPAPSSILAQSVQQTAPVTFADSDDDGEDENDMPSISSSRQPSPPKTSAPTKVIPKRTPASKK
jgi:hypothetical protein